MDGIFTRLEASVRGFRSYLDETEAKVTEMEARRAPDLATQGGFIPPVQPDPGRGHGITEHLPTREPDTVHAAKILKTPTGHRHVTSTGDLQSDGEPRKSSRTLTVASSEKLANAGSIRPLLKPDELPPKDFSLFRLLVGGKPGASTGMQLQPVNGLEDSMLDKLRSFWDTSSTRELGRFTSWFSGKTENCLASQVWAKRKSNWAHGQEFACSECIRSKRPCCRVGLDGEMKPVVVAVLPESGKDDIGRFRYWDGWQPPQSI